MNILCISKLTYDVFCPMDGPIEPGKKYYIKERQDCGGGEAANVAYLLGKWNVKSYVAGVLGADDLAQKVKKELESVLIDTSFIETSFEKPTILSFIPSNKKDGTRSIIRAYKSEYAFLRKRDFGIYPDIIVSDGHEYRATHEMLEKNQKAISVLCADYPTAEVLELCKFMKYILCSVEFAEAIANEKLDFSPNSLSSIYQKLRNRFPNSEVVVTLGSKGALYSVNGEIKVMPGITGKVIDTNGAGDAFRGAFVYSLSNNFPIEKCVTYANLAAGLTIEKMGTRNAFPTLNEVINYYNEKFPPASGQTAQASAAAQPTAPAAPAPTPQATPAQPAAPAAPVSAPSPQPAQQPVVPAAPVPQAPVAAPQDPIPAPASAPSQSAAPQVQAIPDVMPDVQ